MRHDQYVMDARVLYHKVTETEEGELLRDVLREQFHLVAHDMARAKYRTENGITVNGEVSLVNRVLHGGDEVRVRLLYEFPEKVVPVEGTPKILYEDEDLICLNKPAGVVVHPSHGHFADTIANHLAYYWQEKGEPHEIRSVGRLDKDTSGVLTFAKSRTAAAILAGQTGAHPMKKTYLALAYGTFKEPAGTINAPISREYEEKIRRAVREDGAPAVTHYRVLKQYSGYAVLSVAIDTGRTHQIRVHMAHIGHPLLGDPLYGNTGFGSTVEPESETVSPSVPDERNCMHRAALHAWKAELRQPFSGKLLNITAPLPEDMLYYIRFEAQG